MANFVIRCWNCSLIRKCSARIVKITPRNGPDWPFLRLLYLPDYGLYYYGGKAYGFHTANLEMLVTCAMVDFRHRGFNSSPEMILLLESICFFMLSSVGKADIFFFIALITGPFSLADGTLIKILTITASNGKSSIKALVVLLPVRLQVCHY